MTTRERELTEPVDLCTPDGRHLNPEARGWAPRSVHRANLAGGWGRTKRWDYHAVLTREVAVSLVYADIDYLGIVGVWWAHLPSGRSGGREITVPLARGIDLPDHYGTAPLVFRHHHLGVEVVEDADGTHLVARWRERDGRIGRLEATIALPPGHGTVDVVIPWSDRRFQYTSKHQARPATGTLVVGDDRFPLGGQQLGGESEEDDHGDRTDRTEHATHADRTDRGEHDARTDQAWGVLDIGRGRWPYRTRWNWGGGAGRSSDGRVVGLQLGGRWTVGTGATENGIIVDGRVHKLGDELEWEYDWDRPLEPWTVRSPDGALSVTLTPRFDRHARTEAVLLGTEVHQVFGTWAGHVPGPDGDRLQISDLVGFAEESRSRW
ncbi:MAG: DUF2804 domain-containing protein [Nitriliruptoraceae bacterium]